MEHSMTLRRLLLVTLVTLVSSGPVLAQQHARPNVRAGAGAGVHLGAGVHSGMGHMTPQQHHQQMWDDQMMFEDIMRSRIAGSTAKRGSPQAVHQPAYSPENTAGEDRAGLGTFSSRWITHVSSQPQGRRYR
jgi:hypothetical protein